MVLVGMCRMSGNEEWRRSSLAAMRRFRVSGERATKARRSAYKCANVPTRNKGKGMLCSPLMPLSQHPSGLMYEVEEHVQAASTQFQD